MKKNLFFSALLAGAFLFVGCNKDNDDNNPTPTSSEVKNVKNLDASKTGTWTYFSFSKGEVVTVTDPENDTTWDIAFSRMNIKTNGGTSGKGQGEAVFTDNKDFSAVKQTPATGFVKDEMEVPVVRPGMPALPAVSLNKLIRGTVDVADSKAWINYTSPKPPVSTSPKTEITNWVYVVKTADGKFAKIQLTSYTNETLDTGYVSFQYQLSADGKF